MKIEPTKLKLTSVNKWNREFFFEQESLANPCLYGVVYLRLNSAQAFAEVAKYLENAHLAIAAVQKAISALAMAKGPAERLPDLRELQEIHWKLTGYHFTSDEEPAPFDAGKKELHSGLQDDRERI